MSTTHQKNVADAIRTVTAAMQTAGEHQMARRITGDDLVNILLAIADELDSEFERPADEELIDCPDCNAHDWDRSGEHQTGAPITCRGCGHVAFA